MKRKIALIVLCAMLLTGGAYAAAGDADDPLVSLSYLTDTFLPAMRASFQSLAAKSVKRYQQQAQKSDPATKSLALKAGESLELEEGQYFVLSSGEAMMSVTAGKAVNATKGWETTGGAVRTGNRYILCENAVGYVDAATDCTVTVSYGAKVGVGCPFKDVLRGTWYFDDVVNAHSRGLVSGMTLTAYEPAGTLTIAQCVKLAACMHQLYHEKAVTLVPDEGKDWFRPFADYALENGILDAEESNYNAVITRRQFVTLFFRALPASSYRQINEIADGTIPDVDGTAAGDSEIYTFYRAGILSGYTQTAGYAEHAFGPKSSITRAEVAAIMSRMFDSAKRVSFRIG